MQPMIRPLSRTPSFTLSSLTHHASTYHFADSEVNKRFRSHCKIMKNERRPIRRYFGPFIFSIGRKRVQPTVADAVNWSINGYKYCRRNACKSEFQSARLYVNRITAAQEPSQNLNLQMSKSESKNGRLIYNSPFRAEKSCKSHWTLGVKGLTKPIWQICVKLVLFHISKRFKWPF